MCFSFNFGTAQIFEDLIPYTIKNGQMNYIEDSIQYKCPPLFNKMRLIDVNFDGIKDLVIPRDECAFAFVSTPSPYFFVATKSGKLIYSKELSDLYGYVFIDEPSKRIFVYARYNAAGWYWRIYKVIPQKGLKLIDEFMDKGFDHGDVDKSISALKYKEIKLPKTAIQLNGDKYE